MGNSALAPAPTPHSIPCSFPLNRRRPTLVRTAAVEQMEEEEEEEEEVVVVQPCIGNSLPNDLYGQSQAGLLENHKSQRKDRVDSNSNSNCFKLNARQLSITWSDDNRYWCWTSLPESSDTCIEVAELLNVCWLEIHGKFEIGNLSPGILYEVVFIVMLKEPAYGWGVPVNVSLVLPDGNTQHREENLWKSLGDVGLKSQLGSSLLQRLQKTEEISNSLFTSTKVDAGRGVWSSRALPFARNYVKLELTVSAKSLEYK